MPEPGAAATRPGGRRWLRARRPLDALAAGILGVLSAPIVGFAVWRIRRHDGKRAFIRLVRVGQGGRTFGMWKLRTMTPAAQGHSAPGSPLTVADDPRIIPIGHRLRRYRLDELPQFLNVVRGEMALIGPRPETPEFVDRDDPAWALALSVRPGIAGATQVLVHDWEAHLPDDGGSTYRLELLPVKLLIDGWYAQHASLLVDVVVGLAVVERFVTGRRRTILHRRADDLGIPRAAVTAALAGAGTPVA